MYSEKIDNIIDEVIPINVELRELARKIIKDIFAVDPDKTKHTINVSFYTDSWVDNYNFAGVDGNGYGSALSIGDIDVTDEGEPWFNMIDEDGDSYDERTVVDFETTELLYLVRMLNDILNIVKQQGKVNTEMDWTY